MNLEQKIGFDKIRGMIASKCSTNYAAARAENEAISCEENQIQHRLMLTDEMKLICMFEDTFPANGYIDSKEFLLRLNSDQAAIDLQSLVLLRTSLDTLRKILSFFQKAKSAGLYPTLVLMAEPIAQYPEISRRIDTILDKYGEVRDNASEQLAIIRKSLKDKEKSISKNILSILQKAQAEGLVEEGASVSIRDGKTLIPVAAANKKKLSGVVYDESATGKTVFIEPYEVIELNNQVRELQFEEQREIQRILFEFTAFLRPYLPELVESALFMGEIDFIRAKALVAMDIIAVMPVISKDGAVRLHKARHPLLEKALKKENKEMVPLSLELTKEKHILLISGPNAGGKSVCLKTMGLLQYMFQWGMLIPTSEISEMVIFDSVFIDIGDDQSLENDLSTYSSHLMNMREIVASSNEKSLVLIDEFGSGTEPAAGGAIAEAILAELDAKGVYGIITTHYTNLKLFAGNSKGVVNGAMLFDANNIAPLFKLEQGLPGNSFAFELARKIGLPEAIVKKAEELAGEDFVDMEKQLRKIARNRKALDQKLIKVRSADKALEGLTDKYQKELSEIKVLKKQILDQARSEAKEILAGANRQIENTIREIKESQAEKEKTKASRKKLESFRDTILDDHSDASDDKIDRELELLLARKQREQKRKEERARKAGTPVSGNLVKPVPKDNDGPVKVGDKVRIKDGDLIGEVVQISTKSVSVAIGSITTKMAPSKIEKISNAEYKSSLKKSATQFSSTSSYGSESVSKRRLEFSPSIDIRGQRLMDALDIVTHFIDDAQMVGVSQVKILHGKGNGILREEIRKYLKTMPGIKSFADEDITLGGSGITVVYLD